MPIGALAAHITSGRAPHCQTNLDAVGLHLHHEVQRLQHLLPLLHADLAQGLCAELGLPLLLGQLVPVAASQ